jgi:glycosyltransferase involved in cell wall biosynthesis
VRIQALVNQNVYPPVTGGTQRVLSLCRAMARSATVRIACAVNSRERAPRRESAGGVEIARVKTYHPTLLYYLQRARLLPDVLDHAVYRVLPRPLAFALDRAADVWQVDSLSLTAFFDHAPRSALKVYSSQNVEADWFERVGPPLVARRHWVGRVAELERWAVERADLVLAVGEEDREQFVSRYRAAPEKVVVVENGYDPEEVRRPRPEERAAARHRLGLGDERALLFVGSDVAHNRIAVEQLLRHVAPRLGELGARLLLVGGVSAALAGPAARAGGERVRCLGVIGELRAALWAADVALHPVTTGAGSNVKLPAYLAAGLPVVSTPFGTRGFPRLRPFVTEAEVEDFAAAVARGPALDPRVEGALAAHAWPALGERLLGLYRERVGARAERGATAAAAAGSAGAAGQAACAS